MRALSFNHQTMNSRVYETFDENENTVGAVCRSSISSKSRVQLLRREFRRLSKVCKILITSASSRNNVDSRHR